MSRPTPSLRLTCRLACRPVCRLARVPAVFLVLALLGGLGPSPALAQDAEAAAFEAPRPSAIAQFTTAVENREPIDQVTFVPNDVRKLYFFSDLRGLNGRTITHRWLYQGRTMAEVEFVVGGPRWRVWSSKDMLEGWLGDWTVEIVTDDGEVIAAETFTYSDAGA